MDRDPFDLVGDVLDGQFRVDAFAGEGDLSVVYKGHHLGVDAPVAIKCLNLPETLDRALARPLVDGFKEASRVHYRLARGNLHIAQTIASGSTLVPRSGVVVPYLVREWFEGESLASDLARRRAAKQTGRAIDEALTLLETAFDGVAYAHAQGEVHLSINPSNLFVVGGAESDEPPSLKVLDFGVASTMNAFASGIPTGGRGARPAGGLRLLFPAYAAPEQLDRAVGDLGPWTDVYALALVMMEVLSDRVVMSETETGAIVDRALDEQRRPTPQAHGLKLPSHIERALARAVARSPQRRQRNAADLWKDVRNTVRTLAPRPMSIAPAPAPRILTPAPGRARAPTLVGLSPPAILPVPGAVARSAGPGATSVVTKPMAFEPVGAAPLGAAAQFLRTPAPISIAAPNGAAVAGAVAAASALPSARPASLLPLPRVTAAPPPARISALPLPPVPSAPPPRISAMPFPPTSTAPPPGSADAREPSTADVLASVSAFPRPGVTAAPLGPEASVPQARVYPREETGVTPDRVSAVPAPRAPAAVAPPPPDSFAEAPALVDTIDDRLPPRWYTNVLAFPFTPRGAPIVLSVAGGLFWVWALGVFLWLFALPLRHPRTAAVAAPTVASAPPIASAPSAPSVPSVPSAPPIASASVAARRTEPESAPVASTGSPDPSMPDPTTRALPSAAAASPFRTAAAVRALDGKWREVAKCRRGKIWGKASTTVTFAGDGSVTHVEVGAPFAGTPTGDCIAGALSATHVAPFGDSEAALLYRVYVAPR